MRDYWLSKLFFDLQTPTAADEYLANREKVLDRYPLKPEVGRAVLDDDLEFLSTLVNPYLLRYYYYYYYYIVGMTDAVFIQRLRSLQGGRGEVRHRG